MQRTRIRHAVADDAETIAGLVRELAVFEQLEHQCRMTADDVRRDGFGARPYFECLLAEVAGEAVGFALFFHNYSTFEGRPGIYLEDLYVREAYRGRGLGRGMIARLARLAVARDCRRLDLSVLDWNPARDAYARLGFVAKDEWIGYRLEGDALRRLAASAGDEAG